MTNEICPWELAELAKNANFARMTDEFKHLAVTRSREAGIDAARKIIEAFGCVRNEADIRRIIAEHGVEVVEDSQAPVWDRLSEYNEDRKRIICFCQVIDRVQMQIDTKILPWNLLAFCLAHELFHHLEATKIGKTSQYVTLPRRIFGMRWDQGIEASREIAAHTFVQRLLELPYSPVEIIISAGLG